MEIQIKNVCLFVFGIIMLVYVPKGNDFVTIRFIHTADLHLDSPFKGLRSLPKSIFERIQESTFVSFTRIIDVAINENVDFVLISGDVYDGETRSLIAQFRFKKQLKRLQEYQIPVYIIHGNHDHLSGTWAPIEWPDNVHIFGSNLEYKVFQKHHLLVHLYGFSYPQREVTKNIAVTYKKVNCADLHIGLLHGQLEGNSQHAAYAPFTIKDIENKDFHYWALGHVHQRQQVSTKAHYPGNIQGRNRKEDGEKGCLLVVLNEVENDTRFINTAPIRWENIYIDISNFFSTAELVTTLEDIKEKYRNSLEGFLLTCYLTGERPLNLIFTSNDEFEEVLQIVNEGEEERESFVWFVSIENKSKIVIDRSRLMNDKDIRGDILRLMDFYKVNTNEINEIMQEVFHYPKAKRYLQVFEQEDYEQILNEVENMLLHVLSGEEKD